jgi:hypothetical protein
MVRTPKECIEKQAGWFKIDTNYAELLDRIPDMIMVINEHRQAVFVNSAVANYFELENRDELYGMRPGEIFGCVRTEEGYVCGTTSGCAYCGALLTIVTGLSGSDVANECRILLKDGSSLTLRVSSSPFIKNNKPFLVLSLVDISDQKRKEVLERIFFHDIMNTASGISSIGEILKLKLPLEYEHYTERLALASKQLINEIGNQRQLLAAEKGSLLPNPTEIDITQLFKELIEINKNHEFARNCKVDMAPWTEQISIVSDRTILGRVISNMLKNALEASYPDGTVTIGARKFGDKVEISVHNPKVMTDEVKYQIFQKSFSTKGVGRGIGTYSIKLFTERYLGGAVSFQSEEGIGTTFFVSIPINRGE